MIFVGLGSTAQAGQWVVSYETSGTATRSDVGSVAVGPNNEPWALALGGTEAPFVLPGTTQMPPDSKAKSHSRVTVKVVADWVSDFNDPDGPTDPNDRPTDKLWLVERSDASAFISRNPPCSPAWRYVGIDKQEISNPIETSRVPTDDGYYISSYGNPHPTQYDNPQRKSHLELVTRTFDAEAIASIPAVDHRTSQGYAITGVASTHVSYLAYAYTKEVFLSRQGAHGDTPDADGNWHGDTIYSRHHSWTDSLGFSNHDGGLNWQQFDAFLDGYWSWHGDTTAVWQPAYSGAILTWNQWAMVHGGTTIVENEVKGIPIGPVQGTMTYTATDDNDGGSATAKYFLTIHEPFKIIGQETVTLEWENIHQVSAWYLGTVENDTASFQVQVGSEWTAGVSLGGSIPGANVATLEMSVDVSHTWTYSYASGGSAPIAKGWRICMMGKNGVQVHKGKSDAYDTGGSLGVVDWIVRVPDAFPTFYLGEPEYVGFPSDGNGGGRQSPNI